MQMSAITAKSMIDIVNPKVLAAEYAVRGAITERAAEIEKMLASGKSNLPFAKVLYCNIGNPQQLNQKPISYFRQLVACCEYPEVCYNIDPGRNPQVL
jgi:alanine transaminase